MNILSSVWNYKCPRCRKGELYVEPFTFSDPVKMNEECKVCGQNTMPEPGFYYGAMFISYIFTAWICLFIIAICMWGFGLSVNQSFIILIIVALLSYFKVLRLARSIWIHIAVKYDSSFEKK
jgi:uncharacterized protein (DUF983 family)